MLALRRASDALCLRSSRNDSTPCTATCEMLSIVSQRPHAEQALVAPHQLSRNADSRNIRFKPPAPLRAAAIRGPAWINTHVFCKLSRRFWSSVRLNATTRVVVNAKSKSVGGRHSKLPLNLRHPGSVCVNRSTEVSIQDRVRLEVGRNEDQESVRIEF